MDAETQYKIVLVIAEWYTVKSSEPDYPEQFDDNKIPDDLMEISVVFKKLQKKLSVPPYLDPASEFMELCLLLQRLKAGVGGIANKRDLLYMSKLNELDSYDPYETGKDLFSDDRIGFVIRRATPNQQQELPPGALRKFFNELSEKFVR